MARPVNRLILGISQVLVVRIVAALVVATVGLSVLISGTYWAIIFCPITAAVAEGLIWLIRRRFPPKILQTTGC